MRIDPDLYALSERVGTAALRRGVAIATAESCTGGLVAAVLTAVPGSSAWFERGFVTYSDRAKMELLGVPGAVLAEHGAVSEQTAGRMTQGALRASGAQLAVAVTGVAGPGGGSAQKPVGTVCFAWADAARVETLRVQLPGDRAAVREASIRIALEGLLDRLA